MTLYQNLRLVTVFAVAFSLAVLSGPLSSGFHPPTVQLANAAPAPCPTHGSGGQCSDFWVPAGPAMNTWQTQTYTDEYAEYYNLFSISPVIDFPDAPLPSGVTPPFGFLVTDPIAQSTYYEIQFQMANNFWGCQFNFGNSNCGIQIRQGIAHMIDKTAFTGNDPSIAGTSTPIDNPVLTTAGLKAPDPCGYDTSFPQTGPRCVLGAPAGTSYHLANATGANGLAWLQAPGRADLNAAAEHFVNAGLATGFNNVTSVLTGINPVAASIVPSFFIRSDSPPRLDLGNGFTSEICYLFTGSYTTPCQYLSVIRGPITAFPGFITAKTGVLLNWWMYTAAFAVVPTFENLYTIYNSRFVSGIPTIQPPLGPCSSQSVPTQIAPDYMYLCSPNYDSLTYQMETAPTFARASDLGVQAEAFFGANAFTIPVFERTIRFAYANTGWTRAVNADAVGIPNYFTWMSAWNPTAIVPWTIRQGFSDTTQSVNPYIASTVHDLYLVYNIYDPLYKPNPLNPSQSLDWMSIFSTQLPNSLLTYTPPAGTVSTFRFILRSDMFFQDGRPVTANDVAFTYLSMLATGAYLGTGAAPMTGVTVLGPHQIDINVNAAGPFTMQSLASIPILPGAYWTIMGSSAWNSAITSCNSPGGSCYSAQYTLTTAQGPVACVFGCTGFPAGLMNVNPAYTVATFDPVISHSLVGSGAWQCGVVTASGSGTCSTTGFENPPVGGSYTLTRFGSGLAPASSISGIYFRSAGNAALWIWAQQNDIDPFTVFSIVAGCFGMPVDLAGPCGRFQMGIGSVNGIGGVAAPVGPGQVGIENRFYGLNWVRPFDWRTNPPTGIVPFPPVLHEGSWTFNPCSIDPVNGYDC